MMKAHKELDKFLDRKAAVFAEAITNLAWAYYGYGRSQSIPDARKELAETIQRTMILADLMGRKRLLMEIDAAREATANFTEIPTTSPIVPELPFDEAIEDLLTREPRLASSAAEVSRLYNTEHVFAMARSAEAVITKRVQDILTSLVANQRDVNDVRKAIEQAGPFTEAYADTVYRTNVATAYNQGRIEQASDPDLADVVVGFEFNGISDAFTRDNHRAGFGTIAPHDDPIWKTHKPPLGYNCRCGLDYVTRFDAERRGLWKDGKLTPYYPASSASFHADPGFNSGGLF